MMMLVKCYEFPLFVDFYQFTLKIDVQMLKNNPIT